MSDAKVTISVSGKDAAVLVTEHAPGDNSIGDAVDTTHAEAGEKIVVKLGDKVGTIVIKEA